MAIDFFLWGCMKSRVYHSGKPEARHQLVKAIDAAVDIRNELGHLRWKHSVAQRLAVCMQSNGGHFEYVVITLKLNCCNPLK
jgi:hypothetical protein